MRAGEFFESIRQTAKRIQHFYYASAYQRLHRLDSAWREQASDTALYRLPLETFRDVLVYKPDDLGDAVCALPALRLLRESLPAARITVFCQPKTAPLFLRSGLVDAVEIAEVRPRWWRPSVKAVEPKKATVDLSIYLRTYPALFGHFRSISARYQVVPLEPRLRLKSALGVPFERGAHQTEQLTQIVGAIVGQYSRMIPPLSWDAADREAAIQVFPALESRFFVVHPYCRDETRQYPYFSEVMERVVKKTGWPAVVVGAAGESQGSWAGAVDLTGQLEVGALAYLLSRSALFIGNLSGPAHLAGAFGVPSVIFAGGHSAEREWSPLGKPLFLAREVSCSPCYRRYCARGDRACLSELTPDRVWPEIESYLSQKSGRGLES